ncbi:glycosyltransferase family 2 protein [Allomesorhizobium alhagi]|jgi:succinoglycan biosynthesis protein ExoU|uniref:Glycosyltransferase protein n=1 Tax=Mesorhizobium alhagi CCNWXJ12-2 TaxID=1107882 RepID=H0HJE7_9HYPH|nr:glycosyltransferase family 2 protein [Mesorhizobium alhagi]EHK59150.1 glycosyltransferase protein [Mesorhizobium alhagi CCNWXJ12-2]
MASPATVCVIIAAKNASGTIARAIRSGLREGRVAEVVVVDDGSTDGTAEASRAADDGSGRLRVLSLETNRGPAFARNHAIAHSSAPLIAVLDADDFFLAGRFDGLLVGDDWDFVADNIVFIDGTGSVVEPSVPEFESAPRFLDLQGFIEGNISKRGASRGEIGFLKPVMRRSFLDSHGLRYKEELRLGEDYDLYARALVNGARYKIVHGCGYGAVVRPDSLSGRHRTLDLKRLYEADQAILAAPGLPKESAAALRRHERHIRRRYELRNFLDIKAEAGIWRAGLYALTKPSAMPAIAGGVAADKLAAFKARGRPGSVEPAALRYLLPATIAQK